MDVMGDFFFSFKKTNRFVEETNTKLKMGKRTMYGRGSMELLSAKMMLKKIYNG